MLCSLSASLRVMLATTILAKIHGGHLGETKAMYTWTAKCKVEIFAMSAPTLNTQTDLYTFVAKINQCII